MAAKQPQYRRPPHNQVRLKPDVFALLAQAARDANTTSPRHLAALVRADAAARGISPPPTNGTPPP